MLVDKRMTPTELRKAAGVAPNTMNKLRNDLTVNLMILEKICKVLHCDFGYIVEHNDDQE